MTTVPLPLSALSAPRDSYGHSRMPRNWNATQPHHVDRVPYGRYRNVYLYITEACQLRCEHCYMGERLERALKMTPQQIVDTLTVWRKLGGDKLTILGGEPTLHPFYVESITVASKIGYGHVITTTNAQQAARKKFTKLEPSDFAYVQVSLDGGSASTHDAVRARGPSISQWKPPPSCATEVSTLESSAPSTKPTRLTYSTCSPSPTRSGRRW